ncbi:MAG: acyl-CoA reductase [Pirellulaceae bacterium]
MSDLRLDAALEACLSADGACLRVPALVQGQLVVPSPVDADAIAELAAPHGGERPPGGAFRALRLGENWVLPLPGASSQAPGYLVFPRIPPASLLQTDVQRLARELYSLRTSDVLDYVTTLRGALRDVGRVARREALAASLRDDPLLPLIVDQLPLLFDAESLGEAIDRELSIEGRPGRDSLDGWIPVSARAYRGFTARVADGVFGKGSPGILAESAHAFVPRVRAVPTRQLHISAGNSPFIPILSFLRGLAVRGALVIKSPAECSTVATLLALAMHTAVPDHPITRHTSLVYWPGGDRTTEDVLFQAGAFDRIVAWGAPDTVHSIRQRVAGTKTLFLNPRAGISLVGRGAADVDWAPIAQQACIDSLIANQQACISSLVHYVVGTDEDVAEYCRSLQAALAQWDQRVPYRLPPASLGQLRLLRRGAWLQGKWHLNRRDGEISSAVVYLPYAFDLSQHPQSRVIVVRRLDRPDEILKYLSPALSSLGIYPPQWLDALRDAAAAAGVSNLFPLGDAERNYAGMPHDGMRILAELVNWVNSAG